MSKYYSWVKRQGTPNNHNANLPKSNWLLPEERQLIIDYYEKHPENGYRYVTYEMIDNNIVAATPSTVYRVLKEAGVMRSKKGRPGRKGTGFEHPTGAHLQWHTDISYVKVNKQFYFFIGVLDGYSRYMVHWELREKMEEFDVQIVVQRALEKFPDARPRIISDNGSQYTSKGFKEFIGMHGLTHVRTSPYYPQSNGKMERFNSSMKSATVKKTIPVTQEGAEWMITSFVDHYNNERLHSGIGYVTPVAKLEGHHTVIFKERECKLAEARRNRRTKYLNELAQAS